MYLRLLLPAAAFTVAALCLSGCDIAWGSGTTRNITIQSNGTRTTTIVTQNGSSMRFNNDTPDAVVDASFAQSVKPLQVTTDFGSIKVTSSEDGKINAKATIQISQDKLDPAKRKALAAQFRLRLTDIGTNIRLLAFPPADFPKDTGYTVSWVIAVPADLSLDASSENGAVSIENTRTNGNVSASSSFGAVTMTGLNRVQNARARSENGSVTMQNIADADNIVAQSSFGSVTVQNIKKCRMIDANTENGAVKVQAVGSVKSISARSSFGGVNVTQVATQKVNARSENGKVSFSGDASHVVLQSSFGAVSGILGAGVSLADVRMTSENGAVSATFPTSASVSLNAQTENGQISTIGIPDKAKGDDFAKSLQAVFNGGRVPMVLRSDFGGITVTRQ